VAAKVSAGKDEDAGAHRAEAYREPGEGRSRRQAAGLLSLPFEDQQRAGFP
jgi:hypothetical protein